MRLLALVSRVHEDGALAEEVAMLFQQQVEPRPTEPAPGGEGFEVRHLEQNLNHDE